MNIYILSRFPIEAFENDEMQDFLADDLVRAIQDLHTKVIHNSDIVGQVKRCNPHLKYHYVIKVTKL